MLRARAAKGPRLVGRTELPVHRPVRASEHPRDAADGHLSGRRASRDQPGRGVRHSRAGFGPGSGSKAPARAEDQGGRRKGGGTLTGLRDPGLPPRVGDGGGGGRGTEEGDTGGLRKPFPRTAGRHRGGGARPVGPFPRLDRGVRPRR